MPLQKNGVVAQMVEQRTENPCVTGSIPVDATEEMQKSPEHQCVQGFLLLKVAKKLERLVKSAAFLAHLVYRVNSILFTLVYVFDGPSTTILYR